MNNTNNQTRFTNVWKHENISLSYINILYKENLSIISLIGHEELNYLIQQNDDFIAKLHDLSQCDVVLAITAVSYNIQCI